MYNYPFSTTTTVDFSEARRNLSQILNKVFLDREQFVITKRSIPFARIIREENNAPVVKKTLDSPFFGSLKTKKSTLTITRELKRKAWRYLRKT